jgi:glycosyltransferase 2 family protein
MNMRSAGRSETQSDAPKEKRRAHAWIQRLLGYALAAGGLIWVLHDLHPREVLEHLTVRDWRWVAAAIAADILAFIAQGWRWSLLLAPLGKLRGLRATQAIYAGLFTNEMLPLHAGELVRAHVVSRWLGVPFLTVIPSMAVERLMDGVWLALGIAAVALLVPLPPNIGDGADIFGVAVLACIAAFAYLVYWKSTRPTDVGRFVFLNSAAGAFRRIATSGRLWYAAVISLVMILLQAASFWMVMPSYGLDLSFWAGAAVFVIVHIGTAIPNAPANIGTYQLFTVLGLTVFGVDKTVSAGFSFVVFLVLSVPLWIIGFFAFAQTGLSFSRLRQEVDPVRSISR